MIADTQQRIAKVRNEVKAQKVKSGLAYSQLLMPENTPSRSYTGTISLSSSGTGPIARVRFRFVRDDGLLDPPLINFAFTASISPAYKEFVESHGFSISGNDLDYFNWWMVSGYIGEIGDTYVDYYVDVKRNVKNNFFSLSTMSFTVTCEAIANVRGVLIEDRII